MTESQFQSQVIDLAKKCGWIYFHCYDSRRSPEGFPDLVLAKERILYRELKTEKGRLTSAQKQWGYTLLKAGADYGVWRPGDMKEIIETLSKK